MEKEMDFSTKLATLLKEYQKKKIKQTPQGLFGSSLKVCGPFSYFFQQIAKDCERKDCKKISCDIYQGQVTYYVRNTDIKNKLCGHTWIMFFGQIIDLTIDQILEDQISPHKKLKDIINEIPINIWEKQEQIEQCEQGWKFEKPISSYTICYEYRVEEVNPSDFLSNMEKGYRDELSEIKKCIKTKGSQNDYPRM